MENSRLSKLPRELRDMIYALVLLRNEPIRIDFDAPNPGLTLPDQRNILAIASTCKQIRGECAGIFWSENCFELQIGNTNRSHFDAITRLVKWLRHLGYDRACTIRHVNIACNYQDHSEIRGTSFPCHLGTPLAPIVNFFKRAGKHDPPLHSPDAD